MHPGAVVHVIDDDDAMRTALRRLLDTAGFDVELHTSAEAFRSKFDPDRPCCLVLDVRMPGESGLELQQRLAGLSPAPPVIMISAHGDIPGAVRAIKAGAVDFLLKPFDPRVLLERVRAALATDARQRQEERDRSAFRNALARLSPRENEVLQRIVKGESAKEIAANLGLSRKTVDIHRSHVLMKLGVESVADVVRLVLTYPSAGPAAE